MFPLLQILIVTFVPISLLLKAYMVICFRPIPVFEV